LTVSIDDRLRAAALSIDARPNKGEPLWRTCTGRVLPQSEALRILDSGGKEALLWLHHGETRREK
jgi:hypothetical protein